MHGKWAIKSRGGRFKPEEADKLTCPYVGAGELKEGEGGGRNTKQAVRSPGGSWVFFLEEASWKEGTREKA